MATGDRTLQDDLRAALSAGEELSDVVLIGQDGIRVNAFRSILAVRSPVFRQMLLGGNFSESNASDIEVENFSGQILKEVVHFCYTDEICSSINAKEVTETTPQRNGRKGKGSHTSIVIDTEPAERVTDVVLGHLLDLMSAADFFDLPNLAQVLLEPICKQMASTPIHALSVISYARERSDTCPRQGVLREFAKGILHVRARSAFSNETAKAHLTPSNLDWFVNEQTSRGNEEFFLEFLRDWTLEVCTSSEGLESAKKAVSTMDLKHVSPGKLAEFIEQDSLIDEKTARQAFQNQAMLWEKGTPFKRQKRMNDTIYTKKGVVLVMFVASNSDNNLFVLNKGTLASTYHFVTQDLRIEMAVESRTKTAVMTIYSSNDHLHYISETATVNGVYPFSPWTLKQIDDCKRSATDPFSSPPFVLTVP